MAWNDLAAKMDTLVDATVGDTLLYSIAGATAVSLPGFVIDENQGLDLDPLDSSLGTRKRVKIAKVHVPNPGKTDRIQHARLGAGWFQPGNRIPVSEGRYWLLDVQATAT